MTNENYSTNSLVIKYEITKAKHVNCETLLNNEPKTIQKSSDVMPLRIDNLLSLTDGVFENVNYCLKNLNYWDLWTSEILIMDFYYKLFIVIQCT